MAREDENALICDLAQTYQIYNMREYPLFAVSTFASGLKEDSRICMKMEKRTLSRRDALLILMFDNLNWLCWTKTKSAEKHGKPPKRAYDILTGTGNGDGKVTGFETPEDFEKRRSELIGG